MARSPERDNPFAALLTPGERLGWIFQDRDRFRRPFGEPPPTAPAPPFELMDRLRAAQRRLAGRLLKAGGLTFGLVVAVGCCGAIGTIFDGQPGTGFGALLLLAVAGAAGATALVYAHYAELKHRVKTAQARSRAWYDEAHADWRRRKETFDHAEHERVERLPEWGAATPPAGTRRVDVVGGSLWGWEALLTVFGASLLSSRGAMTLVDLSGQAVSRELLRVATENGISVDLTLLPNDLADSDLLVGLDARQLVDALVESMYGDRAAASRADRALDDRVLTTICDALGDDQSLARLAAALRVLMDEPGDTSALTEQERRHIAEDLFGAEVRRHAHPQLRRLEAYLHPLIGLGTRRRVREPASLTCLAAATDGRSVRSELLNDLIVQWLIRRVASGTGDVRSLVIAGADEMPRRDIERLGDLCERRGVRLVLLFRHLRDASVQTLGGGAVGFMRLANHEEARRAADFIGREHTFRLTKLTRAMGGNQTHTTSDTESRGETEGHARGHRQLPTSRNLLNLLVAASRYGRNESRNWSVSRKWSQTRSVAEGMQWSEAEAQERVHEYVVAPRTMQDLPDYALLMVQWQPTGSVVVPVECNPDLISLPGLTMDPLPAPPPPPEGAAAVPAPAAALPVSALPAGQTAEPAPHRRPPRPWDGDPGSRSRDGGPGSRDGEPRDGQPPRR